MKLVGVDAGVNGAVAILDTDTAEVTVDHVPIDSNRSLDSRKLFELLLAADVQGLVVEDTFRPKSVVRFVGKVVAVAEILNLDVIEVVPVVTWKRAVLGENTSDKVKSINRCRELFPDLNLVPPRCRKPSDDWAEAVLLAKWLEAQVSRN